MHNGEKSYRCLNTQFASLSISMCNLVVLVMALLKSSNFSNAVINTKNMHVNWKRFTADMSWLTYKEHRYMNYICTSCVASLIISTATYGMCLWIFYLRSSDVSLVNHWFDLWSNWGQFVDHVIIDIYIISGLSLIWKKKALHWSNIGSMETNFSEIHPYISMA